MRDLIATGGKAGAGKDFIVEKLCKYEAGQNERYVIGGFGDLVRAELPPGASREKQQAHGQLRRSYDQDYWLHRAVEWATKTLDTGRFDVVGFTGVRFENELAYLQGNGFYVGLVTAPEEIRRQRLFDRDGRVWTHEELNHRTETALDEIPWELWDFVWENG